ncbi:DNA repair protein rad50 [Plakobranchus ocellatus]|uniref:DNA repair protein rad50 n=1 Tax=Plakobranchus ocellatus TaxID=259542 RepID=A0AAV4DTD1_9GAST|nr:DNA repair protein rad50 [Plakobranchus ocellatus]
MDDAKTKRVCKQKLQDMMDDAKTKKVCKQKLQDMMDDAKTKKVCKQKLQVMMNDAKTKKVCKQKLQDMMDDAKTKKLCKQKLQDMMDDAKTKKAEFEENEDNVQAKIDELKANKAKLEHSEKLKKETIAKNTTELRELKESLNRMVNSAGRLTSVTADIARAEKELRSVESSVNVDDLQREIQGFEEKKKKLDSSINTLNTEMIQLHKQSEVQTKLDMLLDSQKEKENSIKHLKAEHDDNIQSLLGPVPLDDLRESLSAYIANQSENVKKGNTQLQKLQTSISTKQAEKTATVTQLRQKENELRELENKVSNVCESQDVEAEFTEVQRSLTQAQEERGCLLGAEHMIKKYIRGLERNNPTCPLCSRGFQQAQEIRELILKLQEQLRKVPANMRKAEEDMETFQRKYDEIVQMRPVQEAAGTMRDRDIPALKTKLKKLDEEMKSLKQELEAKEEECVLLEGDLQTAKSLQPDIVDMDRRRAEVRQLQRNIEELKASLSRVDGGDLSGRAMNEVIAEKEEKQLDLETLVKNLELRRTRLSDHQNQVHKLKSRVQELQGEKLSLEAQLQQRTKLEERRANLTSDNTNHQRDIEESHTQLRPIEVNIEHLVKERSEVTKEKEIMVENARTEVDAVKNQGTGVKNLNTTIRAYLQSGKPAQLEKCQKRKAEICEEVMDKEEQQEKVGTKLQQLGEQISGQQVRERELQDNLELHRKQEEVLKLKEKIEELRGKLGDMNLKNLEHDRQQLLKKETALTQQLHNATGRQQGFKDQIKAAERELGDAMYKDAHQKYSNKIIENKTTEIVNGDLHKYYGAMDKAIMMYHKSKMQEINIIIRELWKNTYMGNDIETIEIQSEAEDAQATGAIKSRRTYNYRVVMIKKGIPIDMRGRCSAGQKVLASLIIRLALAETFCVNCGVLALDEPTTNLDRSNIESLALALVRIIQERSSQRHLQRHFQLVVITHDEDFVELLGRSDHVDQYIEVSKNQEGLSRLTIKQVELLHSG